MHSLRIVPDWQQLPFCLTCLVLQENQIQVSKPLQENGFINLRCPNPPFLTQKKTLAHMRSLRIVPDWQQLPFCLTCLVLRENGLVA